MQAKAYLNATLRWEAIDAPFLRPARLTEYISLRADCLQSLELYSSSIGLPI